MTTPVETSESTFTMTPRGDGWTEVRVTPAKGQPALGGPLFFGAVLTPVFGIGLLFGPMLYFMARGNYQRACHQGNHFDISREGLRYPGTRIIPWTEVMHFVQRNPVLGPRAERTISASYVTHGTGSLGVAAAVGAAVGHTMVGAAHVARQQNRSAFAPVGWMLDVVTVAGKRLPLAGGIREETAVALLGAIERVRVG